MVASQYSWNSLCSKLCGGHVKQDDAVVLVCMPRASEGYFEVYIGSERVFSALCYF